MPGGFGTPAPPPNPGATVSSSTSSGPSVSLNSDGTPILPSSGAGGGDVTPGGYTIWDIPHDLIDYLNQLSGNDKGKLWFDIGHKTETTTTEPVFTPKFVEANDLPESAVDTAEKTSSKREAYDIMRRPDQIMMQFRSLEFNDPQKFLALQKLLAQGPWGSVPIGTWSDQMESAIGKAMLDYAKLSMGTTTGMSFRKYLTLTSNNYAAAQAASGQASAPPIRLTDPTAIRASAQSAAEAALGRGLTQDQLDAFVKQFQGEQIKYQTTAGGNVTLPDLSTDAMAFAQQENPKAYKQNQRQSFLDILVNMFAPSGSQRPNMTPVASVGSE